MHRQKRILSTLLAILFFALSTFAQTDRATLEGTVTDASGASVGGAKVRITQTDTGQSQERMTGANGHYRFPGIAIGEYTVSVSRDGFKTNVIKAVNVQVGETRTLDVTLAVGEVTERVEVNAESGPAERSSAESSAVLPTDQIENLPLNGRNWANLTRLAPWAQDDGGGDQRTIRFAGRARDDNNFSYDGIDATGIQEQAQKAEVRLQISPDAIAEYRVTSALYDAEYGSQSGGQIDVVTKSGTNDIHGSVFGYFRNSAFDARNFTDFQADPVTGTLSPYLPPFRMGQYGLTLGGPIVKDKSFLFVSYEGLRQYGGVTLTAAVPDLNVQKAALTGPQAANLCAIFQAFPWRQSSVAALAGTGCTPKFVFPDAAFKNSCTDFPSGSQVCDPAGSPPATQFDNFTHPGASIIHEDTWLARFDHKFSEKTTLYVRAQRDVAFARSPTGNLFDEVGTSNHPGNYIIALQHFFGANLMNEAKFGINRAPFHNPVFPGLIDVSLSTANFESLSNSQTDNEVGTTFSYIDNLAYTRGRHTFKAGIEVKRVRLNQGKTQALSVSFTGDNTSLINNSIDSIDYQTSWDGHALRRTLVMPYFQDEIKLTPTFTLNAGLRWEYYAPITEAHDRVKIFDLLACHGFCSPTSPLEYPNYKNFDPRLSFGWAPSALKGKTVIRSGFGIYHGSAQNDDRNAALESDRTELKFTGGGFQFSPALLQKPPDFTNVGGSSSPGLIARALIRHHPDLYVETWGLSIEHALPQNFLFTVSYLGTHGVHLFARNYENICEPVSTGGCARALDNFPDPTTGQTFGTIDYKSNVGLSSYHGLLFALDRQITKGFSFNAKYTYAHSINDGSVGGGEASAPQNEACLECDKGPSIYDIRHNFILSTVYELPFGPGRQFATSGLGSRVLGGWGLTGLWNWHTGHPLTVGLNPSDPSLLPDNNDGSSPRPDLVSGVSMIPTGQNANNWVNPAAFALPPVNPVTGVLLRYGNAGNGVIRSPHVWQVDLGLQKDTKVTERFGLQFGVQAFNIFNHTQLADPHSLSFDYSCDQTVTPVPCTFTPHSNFGVINSLVNTNINSDKFFADNTGTGLARQIQLFARFKF